SPNFILQLHYLPTSATAEDRTRIGLYFSKVPVQQRLFMVPIINDTFKIPAGEEKYVVNASFTVLPFLDAKAIWVYPHMHLLGRDIKMYMTHRTGDATALVWEDSRDFTCRGSYTDAANIAMPDAPNVS